MNVKCRCCGKLVDRDKAFKVTAGKTNKYYCNKAEYDNIEIQNKIKEDTYNKIFECFGRTITNTILYKEITSIQEVYGYSKINSYISENMDYLYNLMTNKTFQSEYAMIRYFSAILKNNLTDYIHMEEEVNYDIHIDMDIPEMKYKAKKRKRNLEEIEQEVEESSS